MRLLEYLLLEKISQKDIESGLNNDKITTIIPIVNEWLLWNSDEYPIVKYPLDNGYMYKNKIF